MAGAEPTKNEVAPSAPRLASEDEAYSSVGIERVIPIRFVHLRPDNNPLFNSCGPCTTTPVLTCPPPCSLSSAAPHVYAAVEAANMAFRAAGVQFMVRRIEAVNTPVLSNWTNTIPIYWDDVRGELTSIFPNIPPEAHSGSWWAPNEWLAIGVNEWAPTDEITVYVPPGAVDSFSDLPHKGRYMRVGGQDIRYMGLLAHELSHYFGVSHNWIGPDVVDPATGYPATVADFWDNYYCPGAPPKFFNSREELVGFNCPAGLGLISGAPNNGAPANCVMDAYQKLTCTVGGAQYTSDDWELQGLSFRAPVGIRQYGSNVASYVGTTGGNRLTKSGVELVRKNIRHEVTSSAGSFGFRPALGLQQHSQPQLRVDFDGDGKRDIAIWNPPTSATGTGSFQVRLSSYSFSSAYTLTANQGQVNDQPLLMDFNGDGRTDIGWYRPSNFFGGEMDPATWYWCLTKAVPYQDPCDVVYSKQFGTRGDIPLPGQDFDGDGRDDIAIYRPTAGRWVWALGASGFATTDSRNFPVQRGTLPLPGLYDSDEKTDIVWWNQYTATFHLSLSTSNWPTTNWVTRFHGVDCGAGSGSFAERTGCVPVPGMMSWYNGVKKRQGIATWDAATSEYRFNFSPVTSNSYVSCSILADPSTEGGRIAPISLMDFLPDTFIPLTSTSLSLFKWGQGNGSGYLKRRTVTSTGCSWGTTTNDLGPTPNHWWTFSVPDIGGDGAADIVQFDPGTRYWWIYHSPNFSTFTTFGPFGSAYSIFL